MTIKKIKLLNGYTGNQDTHITDNHNGQNLKNATMDANAICCEVYNKGVNELTFVECDKDLNPLLVNPRAIICKKHDWCFLPHQYFIVFTSDGGPATILKSFGEAKFKGNKHPSRPEAKK